MVRDSRESAPDPTGQFCKRQICELLFGNYNNSKIRATRSPDYISDSPLEQMPTSCEFANLLANDDPRGKGVSGGTVI